MLPRVRITVRANTRGLDHAERTLAQSLTNALEGLGKHLQRALRGRVRYASGGEKRNIKYEVRGQGFSKALVVFGDLIQLWIDEYGLRPGVFPPWQIGSRLYKYVEHAGLVRRGRPARSKKSPRLASHVSTRRPGPRRAPGIQRAAAGGPSRRVGRSRRNAAPLAKQSSAATRRAKATQRLAFLVARKIFESGIQAARPIAKTFEANKAKILRDVSNAFTRAVAKINRGTA